MTTLLIVLYVLCYVAIVVLFVLYIDHSICILFKAVVPNLGVVSWFPEGGGDLPFCRGCICPTFKKLHCFWGTSKPRNTVLKKRPGVSTSLKGTIAFGNLLSSTYIFLKNRYNVTSFDVMSDINSGRGPDRLLEPGSWLGTSFKVLASLLVSLVRFGWEGRA